MKYLHRKKGMSMEELKKVLQQDVARLERIKKAAEADLKCAPQGTLRIAQNKNTVQYYWRKNSRDRKGTYIRKKKRN